MVRLRQSAGLIAALLLTAFACLVIPGGRTLGIGLFLAGAALTLWRLYEAIASRPDPYDLSRLWDRTPEPPAEADETVVEDEGTLYCHSCGHAVPRELHRCPECGRQLT